MPLPQKAYSPQERERALQLAAEVGFIEASKQTGIPVATLYTWQKRAKNRLRKHAEKALQQATQPSQPVVDDDKVSPDPKRRFLAYLRDFFSVGKAAQLAGLSRSQVVKWREEDPEFARQWDDIMQTHLDELEREMYERARRKEKPDTIAGIFLLKGHRPEKFADRIQHTGPDGGPLQIVVGQQLPSIYGGKGKKQPGAAS